MNWDDLDTIIPDRPWPASDAGPSARPSWGVLRMRCEALVTHFARAVAGLPATTIDRADVSSSILWGYREA
jgi:hypothetical protein